MTTLEKLKKELVKTEAILEKNRTICAELIPKWNKRRTRAEINWDYYAMKKNKLKELIEMEELKQSNP